MKYLTQNEGERVDVKSIADKELKVLAQEMRDAIMNKVSKKGGHLAPNLGFVEGTIALHRVFDPYSDKIVFDVSHQCYPHKLLTGRSFAFLDTSKFDKITGYTNPAESPADQFITGHTSTSIATSLGLAIARDRNGTNEKVIAVIGDGSLSGGLALEALNTAGEYNSQLLIIVNDNAMSISENHGGLYCNLEELKNTKGKAKENIFHTFGLDYVYLEEGNDVLKFIKALEGVKDAKKPVVLHVHTKKGAGYAPAEKDPEKFHYTAPFNVETGETLFSFPSGIGKETYDFLFEKIKKGAKLQILNAATASTLEMDKKLRDDLGDNYIDFGIAEQNMVSSAAGMAKGGIIPIVPVYSTFLGRAYDQIFHDVAINDLPVIFLVFSNGIFGMRDVTHNGLFTDVIISNFPNLNLVCPVNSQEYFDVLDVAVSGQYGKPIAIKVPEHPNPSKYVGPVTSPAPRFIKEGGTIAVIGVGDMLAAAEGVWENLKKFGISSSLISVIFTSVNMEIGALRSIISKYSLVVVLDNGPLFSGFASKLGVLNYGNTKIISISYPNQFIDGYDINKFTKDNMMDADILTKFIFDNL